MSATRKAEIMEKVTASRAPVRQVLRQLDVPKSTYYRWRTRANVSDRRARLIPWNRLTEGERQRVLTVARASPAWSSRQVAAWITDNDNFSVSESTVFRILKRKGLVRRIEVPAPASDEYRHKTTAPHQLWATDASYFRVAGWGYYYYMVTVLDDYSRFILAWRLQVDMTSASLIEVVQDAIDLTGMTDVSVENRTMLPYVLRVWLRIETFQGVPSVGRHPARTRCAVPPADQREARALPPDAEEGREPTALRRAERVGGCNREVRRLLQLSPVPQGAQGHYSGGHVGRPEGRDSRQKKRGETADNRTT